MLESDNPRSDNSPGISVSTDRRTEGTRVVGLREAHGGRRLSPAATDPYFAKPNIPGYRTFSPLLHEQISIRSGAFEVQLQVELGRSDRDDSQMAVDGHEVAIHQEFGRIANSVDARDPEFSRDDCAVDQHSASALDDGAGQRNEMCHRWLDRVADDDFTAPELGEVVAATDATHQPAADAR